MMRPDTLLLALHIGAGTVALVVAPCALAARKGGVWHRRWGLVFVGSMLMVALTASAIMLFRPSALLGGLAMLAAYLTLKGWAAVRLRPGRPPAPRLRTARTVAALLLLAGAILLLVTVRRADDGMAPVHLAFGITGLLILLRDRRAEPNPLPHAWWRDHVRGMLAAYIAAVSAFSVLNLTMLPTGVRWLWPTMLGTPLIAYWIRTRAPGRRAIDTP